MYIGIDIGGTTVKMATLDSNYNIVDKWKLNTGNAVTKKNILLAIIDSLKEYFSVNHLKSSDFKGIGIGSPGTVNSAKGTVSGAHNLGWKEETDVKKIIEENMELPVRIDNDANVAALGEQFKGAGEKNPNIVFITLGTGVGGGIILNNELIRGANNSAGEIGHFTVDPDGFKCTCGNVGCLETVASGTGIINLAKRNIDYFDKNSKLLDDLRKNKKIDSEIIFDYGIKDDSYAKYILNQMGFYLGLSSSYLANAFDPSVIIFGGGLSAAGPILIDYIQPYFSKYTFPNIKNKTKLRLASLGNDAGVIGAALLLKEI